MIFVITKGVSFFFFTLSWIRRLTGKCKIKKKNLTIETLYESRRRYRFSWKSRVREKNEYVSRVRDDMTLSTRVFVEKNTFNVV